MPKALVISRAAWVRALSTAFESEDALSQDRSGQSKATKLLEVIRNLDRTSSEFAALLQSICDYASNLSQWDPARLSRFLNFLVAADVVTHRVRDAFADILRTTVAKEDAAKRGLLLKFLVSQGANYPPKIIEQEFDLKRQEPWLWIDAMLPISLSRASNFISSLLRQSGQARNLALRLPSWWKLYGNVLIPELRSWLKCISDPNDKRAIETWISTYGVTLTDPQQDPSQQDSVTVGIGGLLDNFSRLRSNLPARYSHIFSQ